VLSEFRGIQIVEGELAVVAVKQTAIGPEFISMPVETAHAVGCMLIELCDLAKEREDELRRSGELLDIRAMTDEFMVRVRRRQELNARTVPVNDVASD
jgi:hypothetical protein